MSIDEYEIVIYKSPQGIEPFREWFHSIRDKKTQGIILLRIQRLRNGLLGDHRLLTNTAGVFELRIDFGPGYRIYYSKIGNKLFILLGGGDKSSQRSDIRKANESLLTFRKTHGK